MSGRVVWGGEGGSGGGGEGGEGGGEGSLARAARAGVATAALAGEGRRAAACASLDCSSARLDEADTSA